MPAGFVPANGLFLPLPLPARTLSILPRPPPGRGERARKAGTARGKASTLGRSTIWPRNPLVPRYDRHPPPRGGSFVTPNSKSGDGKIAKTRGRSPCSLDRSTRTNRPAPILGFSDNRDTFLRLRVVCRQADRRFPSEAGPTRSAFASRGARLQAEQAVRLLPRVDKATL